MCGIVWKFIDLGRTRSSSERLARAATEKGVLIEPGRVNFGAEDGPRNFYRLAFSSIEEKKIEPGIRLLSELVGR